MRAYLSTTGHDKHVGTSGDRGGDNKDPHPTNFIFKKNYYGDDNEGKSLVPQLCFTMVAPRWCCPPSPPHHPSHPPTTTTTPPTNTKIHVIFVNFCARFYC